MVEVVKFASGDPQKASLLITHKGERRTFILFDYDNPDHDECPVLGFTVKRHIKHVHNPPGVAAYVHGEVNMQINASKEKGGPFPCRMERVVSCLVGLST